MSKLDFTTIITDAIAGQGLWTICAVLLTVYTIKTSGERETRLQSIIEKYADKLDILDDKIDNIQNDLEELKR